ncbi:recombination regulator RecX [Vagococcus coleopterorum]|uniref:recombination regulator RecX n=1 Tax=Vagococcus coleopterorum TaxID=2714946 RepID=UPI003B834D26
METVKGLLKLKNNLYKVSLTSGKSFRVSEDVLVRRRLLKGTELSEEEIAEIQKQTQLDHGYQQALNYLSYQLRSEKEIHDYLVKKEIELPSRLEIIERLKSLNLVDDLVFSESYIRTQARLSDKGPRVLKDKLRQKGIKADIIEQALEQFPSDEQEEVAKIAAQKALKKYQRHSFVEQQQKIKQLLMTKGFSPDVISLAIQDLEMEKDPESEVEKLAVLGDKLWRKNQRHDLSKRKQKVTQSLYQKGFNFDDIRAFLSEKEMEDE